MFLLNQYCSTLCVFSVDQFKQKKKVSFDCCNKFRTREVADSQSMLVSWKRFTLVTGDGGVAPQSQRCINVILINLTQPQQPVTGCISFIKRSQWGSHSSTSVNETQASHTRCFKGNFKVLSFKVPFRLDTFNSALRLEVTL